MIAISKTCLKSLQNKNIWILTEEKLCEINNNFYFSNHWLLFDNSNKRTIKLETQSRDQYWWGKYHQFLDMFRQRTPSHIYTQNMPGMDDRLSSIKGVREDIQVGKQQIY
jgi:hypothetical protein